jgi:hypothetical protein
MKHTLTIPYEAPHVHQLDSPVCAVCGKPLSLVPVDGYSAHHGLHDDPDSPSYDDPYAISGCAKFWEQDDYAWLTCTVGCSGELNLSIVDENNRRHGLWMFNKALAALRHAGRGEVGRAA